MFRICSGFRAGLSCPYVLTVHDLLEHMYGSRNVSSMRRSLHFHLTRRVLRGAARDDRGIAIYEERN